MSSRIARCILAVLLLPAALCLGQYHTSYSASTTDVTSWATSGYNAFKLMAGGGICKPQSLALGTGIFPYCVGTDLHAYQFSTTNHSWTQLTSIGVLPANALIVGGSMKRLFIAMNSCTTNGVAGRQLW